ncbi:MAG: MBOAT family O-acyltransferase, partial [Clostridiales bacterium]
MFSLFFYFYGEPTGIMVMFASILINYGAARWMENKRGLSRKIGLMVAVMMNLSLLVWFKYAGFALENMNTWWGTAFTIPVAIMPIGISFFTFQGLSYLLDVYRGQVSAQRNLLNIAMYISLFPQLVAGPIVRYSTIADEVNNRRENLADVEKGLRRFIYGLAKKLLLANSFGVMAVAVFAMDYGTIPAAVAWLGVCAFTLQIFYDFAGYSDMAIGLGLLFGFHFPENFNYPYISKSISEFWRRWHISLSGWFRDYVYIPLGGNRRGLKRQLINILIVWSLTGLWHGAAWNFVLWGLYFALILVCEKLFLAKWLDKIPAFFAHAYSLLLIFCGWVIFNCGSVSDVAAYFTAMFGGNQPSAATGNYVLYCLLQYKWEWLVGILCCAPIAPICSRFFDGRA